MYAVMVCTLEHGLSAICGVAPAAMVTAMVSPTARETPRIKAATIPDRAAGNTTRNETRILVEPRPYAPSRRERGTALIASSDSDATVGKMKSPTTIAAEPQLKIPHPS